MARSEVKWGALLSYLLIFINSIYGLIISPYVLGTIGASEYGVYKTIGSLTSTISVMELGLGGTMQKFLAQYRAQKDQRRCFNFSAMCMMFAGALACVMALIGGGLFFTLEPTYGATFSAGELARAKQIYLVLIAYVSLHIFENVFFGVIAGYNRFIFSNSVKVTAILVRILLYFVVLPVFRNALAIVLISLALELAIIAVEYVYIRFRLGHRIKFCFWDKTAFKEAFSYTILLFIQSLIIQFNGNIDNIVIGAVIGTSAVTVYSFAIQIFNMYEQCATSVSGVLLPSVTNMIYNGATAKDLEALVVKYGRVQWAVLGAALGGFICLGREFFGLWLGKGFEDCYYLALILMIPVTFPLIVNVCLSILKAKNLLGFRTAALAYSMVLNAVLTVIGTRIWGYWAAAIGTAISTVVGSVISLNIYYKVKLGMNVFRLYLKIFHRITPCILLACVPAWLLGGVWSGSWLSFFAKAAVYVAVYGAAMAMDYFLFNKKRTSVLKKR